MSMLRANFPLLLSPLDLAFLRPAHTVCSRPQINGCSVGNFTGRTFQCHAHYSVAWLQFKEHFKTALSGHSPSSFFLPGHRPLLKILTLKLLPHWLALLTSKPLTKAEVIPFVPSWSWRSRPFFILAQDSSLNLKPSNHIHHLSVRRPFFPLIISTSSKQDLSCLESPNLSSIKMLILVSVQFSSVASDSLQSHELQHARPPCPSPTTRVYSNSHPLSPWCHPTISSSVVPFSSSLQSFPASGSFQMNQLFSSGGQTIGVSASNQSFQGIFRTDLL